MRARPSSYAAASARRRAVHASRWRSLTRSAAACTSSSLEFIPTASCTYFVRAPWFRSVRSAAARSGSSVTTRAAVAVRAQVLGREEAEAAHLAQAAGAAAAVGAAEGLAGVLDDGDAAPGGDGAEGVHVGGHAVEVRDDDARGCGR